MSLGLSIDIDEDISDSWKDNNENFRIYKNYYLGLKNNKNNLIDQKMYYSTDIKKEEEVINNILDFLTIMNQIKKKCQNLIQIMKTNSSSFAFNAKAHGTKIEVVTNFNLANAIIV